MTDMASTTEGVGVRHTSDPFANGQLAEEVLPLDFVGPAHSIGEGAASGNLGYFGFPAHDRGP